MRRPPPVLLAALPVPACDRGPEQPGAGPVTRPGPPSNR